MQTLELKKGARIRLIFNISTKDDLTNGELGTIIDFHKNSKGFIDGIVVAFDNGKSGERHRVAYATISGKFKDSNGTPIFRTEIEKYTAKYSKNRSNKQKIYQFPVILSWGLTAHTMQVSKLHTADICS